MAFFQPDRHFDRITSIDVTCDLVALGFTHVLLDVDNTIKSRETHQVPEDVASWLARARDAGLTLFLFSNNWHQSVYDLAKELGLPIIAQAMKPLPHAYFLARSRMGCPLGKAVAIGDQLLTDVCGAHVVGVTAYLVDPLAETDLRHTVVLRKLERRLMGGK